jgi:hypothetical protein
VHRIIVAKVLTETDGLLDIPKPTVLDDFGQWVEKDNCTPVISFYPNPSSTDFTVSISGYDHNYQLTIFDQLGRPLRNEGVQSGINTISIANMPAGIYNVQLMDQNGVLLENGRIVKL